MKELVMQLDYSDDKMKQKVMQKVAAMRGIQSFSIDRQDKKLTVVGDFDPVNVVDQLRKICPTDVVALETAEEAEKEEEEPKKDDGKKKKKKQTCCIC